MQKIPITTGIVGHRDAVITEAHRQVIKRIFLDLLKKYPHSPLVLFSQLAPGADTVVAALFLEVKAETNRDMQLIASIPFDKAAYIHTQFTTEQEQQTFSKLLSQSERFFEIYHLPEKLKKAVKEGKHPEELNEYYRQGAEFVADSSVVFLALWDETDNQLEGGTANTVMYKRTGTYKEFISGQIFEKQGSLISIPCNRKHQNKNIVLKDNYLDELLQNQSIKKALEKIDYLNKKLPETDKEFLKTQANYLYPENKIKDKELKFIYDAYTLTDTLALTHQKKYNRILLALFILGFIIFIFFEAYKHLGLHQVLFFSTVGLIAFAFAIFKISFKNKNHKNYIENRVLAEALRVQFFWKLAGINKKTSDYILRIHKKEYSWITHILQAIYGMAFSHNNTSNYKNAQKYWIDNQNNYFSKIKLENEIEPIEKFFNRASYITFSLGLIILIGIFLVHKNNDENHWLHPLIVLDSVVFGLFALLKAYYEKKGYEETKTQYELMRDIYKAASEKISELSSGKSNEKIEEQIKKIMYYAGREALVENGNWYMIYKEKEPEIEGLG